MERLQQMLIEYNIATVGRIAGVEWAAQYRSLPFPRYWELIFELMSGQSRDSRVIEVGGGCGDVTSILCYQGFESVKSYERDPLLGSYAQEKIECLFDRTGIIENQHFGTSSKNESDILIMVNCAYADDTHTKSEYMESLLGTYHAAGCPKTAYIEVIDASFTESHPDYPIHIRLDANDVKTLFPECSIRSWQTYAYPANGKTKTLYEIEAA